MRIRNAVLVSTLMLMPLIFRGDQKVSRLPRTPSLQGETAPDPEKLGEFSNYISARPILVTPPQCSMPAPRPARIPVIITPNMEVQVRLVRGTLNEFDPMNSAAFKEFKKLTADLSDEELCGLATADSHQFLFNWGLLKGLPTYTSRNPFEHPRDYFLFMAFLNASGKLLSVYDKLGALRKQDAPGESKAGIKELETLLHNPQLFRLEDFIEYLKLFEEVYVAAQQYRDVEVFFDHPSYIWVASSMVVRKLTNPHPKQGKWVVHINSRRAGIEMLKKVLACFDMNRLQIIKFDLDPFIAGVWRLIFYAEEKDSVVKAIAESVAGTPALWTYDWQCLEGQTLSDVIIPIAMQNNVSEKDRENFEEYAEKLAALYQEIEADPAIFRDLGFSEFQRQVFLRSLFLAEDQDLTNPATTIAHGYIRFPGLAWLALPYIRDPKFKPLIQRELEAERVKKEDWNQPGLDW